MAASRGDTGELTVAPRRGAENLTIKMPDRMNGATDGLPSGTEDGLRNRVSTIVLGKPIREKISI